MAAPVQASPDPDPFALNLPFSAESARVARQQLLSWLETVDAAVECCEDARLVVSELVGNAVRHARPLADGTMRVAWAQLANGIDIAVSDGGARTAPERRDPALSDLAGRGLAIVDVLASRWWVETSRSRTTVHALLPVG
ncbi:MAG: anti-sigma regulatory factor [Marmoricola sp.]|nr:anti-sigma regulatory factor [Marmoricola sp.]